MEEPQALIYLAFEPLMPNPTANYGLNKKATLEIKF
jgi:hypothetical protein